MESPAIVNYHIPLILPTLPERRMSQPKKHHFLPQFYLGGFADAKKPTQLCQIDKQPDARHFPVAIRDAAERSHYHTMTDGAGNRDSATIEEALSKVEDIQAQLLSRITAKAPLAAVDRSLLTDFLALMDMRVPSFKAYIQKQYKLSFDAFGKVMLKDDRLDCAFASHPDPKFAAFPPGIKKAFVERTRKAIVNNEFQLDVPNGTLLRAMFEAAADERLLRIIRRMGVTFLEAPEGSFFLTGDTPVARFYPRRLASGQPGVGLADPVIQLTIPLSTRFLARFDWSDAAMVYETVTADEVAEFNRRTIITAQKHIFAPCTTPEIVAIIKASAHLSAGSGLTLHHNPEEGNCLMHSCSIPVLPADCYITEA
jgi:hypothetical protein